MRDKLDAAPQTVIHKKQSGQPLCFFMLSLSSYRQTLFFQFSFHEEVYNQYAQTTRNAHIKRKSVTVL